MSSADEVGVAVAEIQSVRFEFDRNSVEYWWTLFVGNMGCTSSVIGGNGALTITKRLKRVIVGILRKDICALAKKQILAPIPDVNAAHYTVLHRFTIYMFNNSNMR